MLHFLPSRTTQPALTGAKAALVTIVMGEKYERAWERLCRPTWVGYAARFGFDIVVIQDRLDPKDARSPAWQKLLVLDQPWAKRYQRIVWLDSDILIAQGAPDILKHAGPPEKIGLCLDGARLSDAETQIYVERLNGIQLGPDLYSTVRAQTKRFMYANNDVPEHEIAYNTGVMALSPKHHNELLLSCYSQPEVTDIYEQPYLSHLLVECGKVFPINPRFNWGFIESLNIYFRSGLRGDEDEAYLTRSILHLARAELRNAYFLHFYSALDFLDAFASDPALAVALMA